MKFKILCTAILFAGISQFANAQLSAVGIQPKMNFSRHMNIEQTVPLRLARSVEGFLSAPGIDAFVDFNLGDKWKFRAKAGFETKGFVSSYFAYELNERAQKYHYVSNDLNIIRNWGKNKKIQPYSYLGVTSGYLFKDNAKVLAEYQAKIFPNSVSLTYDNYSKFNLGFNLGIGLSFNNVLWLELEYNRDILAPINQTDIKVFNTVYSVNVGINLLKLFQK